MFKAFRTWCEEVLRIPGDPEPPPGDEARTQRFRAAPNYYRYLLGLWAVKTAAVFIVLVTMEMGAIVELFKAPQQKLPGALVVGLPQIIVLFFFIGRLLSLALVRLDFEKRWYLVTDRSLRLREGIVHVREMTITFANIQNISISQGPLQRLLGIADLRVDTAGGSAPRRRERKGMPQSLHTAFFRGVDNADAIRELIQTRLRELKDSGLGDHEEAARATPPAALRVPSAQLLAALREVAAEATALREAVGR
ncbi:MAG TPA: PH domain-containing protein [Chthoniobacterales bacterium]|nr:PH domain-containing protein [Chthoniobacterales bacterium]